MQQHGWTLLFHDNLIEQTAPGAQPRCVRKKASRRASVQLPGPVFRALVQLTQMLCRVIQRVTNTVRATPWGRPIATWPAG